MKKASFRLKNPTLYFLVAVLCAFLPLRATQLDASWTSGGPPGGYINTLAMATNPDVIYAGTEFGVFKTVDGGDTWTKTNFPEIPVRVIQVAPENPDPAIDFDDVTAPCSFAQTTALTNEYSVLDVVFSGPGSNDGGAILDECAGFSVTGHSSPNFLAFDTSASLSDGGVPRGPETITFNTPVTYVKINVGSVAGTIVSMEAYDDLNNLIDSDAIYSTSTLTPISVSGTGIITVVIVLTGVPTDTPVVLDDLAFIVQQVEQPDIVYAGTDYGVYKSEDGGINWSQKNGQSGELSGARVNAIAIDPRNPETLYAGTSGSTVGIFKSTDGGEGWDLKCSEDMDAVQSLLINTNNSSIVYAGVYHFDSWMNDGIRKSIDGGETWEGRHIGTSMSANVVALAMTPAMYAPEEIYAIKAETQTDVYKSTDGGDNWTPTNTPWISFAPPGALAVDPNAPNVVYVGTHYSQGGFYKSPDGGGTWSIKTNGLPPNCPSSIVIDRRDSSLYVGLIEGGVYKSGDGAETWIEASQGVNNAYILDIAVDPGSSGTVFATIKGKGCHLAKTTNGGKSWECLINPPPSLWAVTVDPQNPSTIFVGKRTQLGTLFYIHKSLDGGQTWHSIQFLETSQLSGFGVSDIWVKPNDSHTILVAGVLEDSGLAGGIFKTTDNGALWQQTFFFSSRTLAADPYDPNKVYVGTEANGYVYQSEDCGNTWNLISPGGEWVGEVRDLDVDSHSHVYAATDEGLLKWAGAGDVWTKLVGLPTDNNLAVTIDRSVTPEVVYVGTWGEGVFFSRDGGIQWFPFSQNLVNGLIFKLAMSNSLPKILYAGLGYGGVWSRKLSPQQAMPWIPLLLLDD